MKGSVLKCAQTVLKPTYKAPQRLVKLETIIR